MTTPDIGGWLRDNASLLRTLDPNDDDFSDLEPLRDIVGTARVVAIGENTHRIHEFYQIRHRLTRFLVRELGFTAFVMESGFPEGFAVNEWVTGGAGDLESLLRHGITYHMGRCAEMRDQLRWMRAQELPVHFYGMDIPDSSASSRPATQTALTYLDKVDQPYADAARGRLMPLYDYLPTDRGGLAWSAPTLQAYLALPPAARFEMTARIGELVERMRAMRVTYVSRSGEEAFEVAYQCAITGRHTDAFLQAMAAGAERTYAGANIRDVAMAENVEWILGREERIVLAGANGHVQRWPFSAPPIINDPLTTVGEHLAASLGDELVVIGTTFGGGELFVHRPIPGGLPGHTRTSVEELPELAPDSIDELLASSGMPRFLLDLRSVPTTGVVAERFAATRSTMTGSQPSPLDPLAAYDAVVHVGAVTPWHHTLIS
ncbi:erythromycin esterase family protein [Fodinicola feengrottensis]|uniref:Erythromycin esterase family protein n=1 Tax=Fodinicola feengrottensis TaxID=435914 RepID=A0ABP4RQQ9_9ACTN|nr:erythromycin esterase family protein [Fodinicola feengrottensis]